MNSGSTAKQSGLLFRCALGAIVLCLGGCELLQVADDRDIATIPASHDRHPGEPATGAAVEAPAVPADEAAPVPPPGPVDEELSLAQEILRAMGLYAGRIDGIYGPKTRQALLDYQYGNALSLTGVLDLETRLSLFKTQ